MELRGGHSLTEERKARKKRQSLILEQKEQGASFLLISQFKGKWSISLQLHILLENMLFKSYWVRYGIERPDLL